MDYEQAAWYRLMLLVLSAVGTVFLLDAVHARWQGSMLGIVLFVLCLGGIERLLQTLIPILVILFKPRRR